MQDTTLSEALFRSEYHHALVNIMKNSKEILQKLLGAIPETKGDIQQFDIEEPLPVTVKMPIKKKM